MNKKIKESSLNEIKQCYKNLKIIKIKRFKSLKSFYEPFDGVITKHYQYGLDNALNDDLGLEYRCYMAKHDRAKRISKRISYYLTFKNCLFLTMTFNDNLLVSTNQETRKRYIKDFLKNQCLYYIANIDFGSTNEREHYHAVVVPKNETIDLGLYRSMFKESNINFKHIFTTDKKTSVRLGKYINKLTNHALKDNGFYQRLIFSRAHK